jgi:hypothetical protein
MALGCGEWGTTHRVRDGAPRCVGRGAARWSVDVGGAMECGTATNMARDRGLRDVRRRGKEEAWRHEAKRVGIGDFCFFLDKVVATKRL